MHSFSHYRIVIPFLAFLLALNSLAFPQEHLFPVFRFEQLTTYQGLPSNEIRSNIVTDRQGFIWIGTVNGLARYDGNSCKVYRNVPGDPHSISSNGIMSLLLDRRGLLWVGTFDSGISLYDADNDRFVNFVPRGKDSTLLGLKACLYSYEDRVGNVWFSSYENKVVLADMSGLVDETSVDSVAAHVRFEMFRIEGSKEAVFMGEWDEQSLLFGTARGLFTYNRATRMMSRLALPPASGISLDTVRTMAFCWETAGRLWIATRLHGLYLFDRSRASLTAFHKRRAGGKEPRDETITDVLIDSSGRLWVATTTTLDLFDPSSGMYKEYLTSPLDPPKYPYLVSMDRMGRVWVSTMDDGLYFLAPQSLRFPHYALKRADGRPKSMETIDEAGDGTYWIATEGKVARVRMEDLTVLQTVDLFKGKQPTYWRAGVMDSYRDAKGTLWYGTWGLGLYKFKPGTGAVTNYRFSKQLSDVINKNDVCWSVTGGTGDALWIGAYRDGLLKFDTHNNIFSRQPIPGSTTLVCVYQVMKDNGGKIWVSDEQQGVVVFDPATNTAEHFTHNPDDPSSLSDDRGRHTYQDPDGNIWIGTKDLNLWNPENRSFKRYSNGAFSSTNFVMPMRTDSQERLWVYYYPGAVGILDRTIGTFSNIAPSDGLCANIYEMSLLQNGKIVLVGWGGMNIISPESLSTSQPIPPLVLTRMSINDSLNLSAQRLSGAALRLPHDQNSLEFEFAAIDPGSGLLIAYQYRLEGLEDFWVHPVGRRFVRYPSLAPGEYVFKVRAVSTYGRWPDQEIALAIVVVPPWWQTIWFRLLAGGLIVGLLGYVYRREVSRLRRDRALQEEFSRRQIESQEAERKRVAAELHDGLGQDLLVVSNELQQFLQNHEGEKEELQQIASLVQGSIESVREISSNLHPHHIDRLGFCAAIEAMTDHVSRSSGIAVHRACDPVDGLLPKESEIHLYRIIQEALANAVRHAQARTVTIQVWKTPGAIDVVVADDGKGFNVAEVSRGREPTPVVKSMHGFGLSSMGERARIIGGKLSIESKPGTGTRVSVTVPYS